ncbi:hypothetical protein GCM10007923_51840 [Shinella yambaruensis]|uniref:Uncharacterized protein n=1 Tax=Shinella yambaruensis TaxID=415996 RepID=A0ABQ5ZQ53_9HYPH|nr:hypothetical protein [Shinella sp.]MDC7253746.1 hypothetical protein [Shinella sp. YE25]GLR53967.1 hypothetical protein GCM10007923_51840 [Shinella yambaruensis]CAI0336389.1 conserved hypothetical protein [Rhizobiaceae bacterium]CAK7254927.1 conserved protein of unknown function [Shinella sp. WSC3-e]
MEYRRVQQTKFRYYDAVAYKRANQPKPAVHTEFLRTGRIDRNLPWSPSEKRYLTYQEVAERTGRKLENAGNVTHDRINGFHQSIRFPKLIFHRTLAQTPHLGYCHITVANSRFAEFENVQWAFYMANFFAEIGEEEQFFADISKTAKRMYFAVAITPAEEEGRLQIDRKVRGNGVLFRTDDPKLAMKNVLMLGAHNEALRKIIRAL